MAGGGTDVCEVVAFASGADDGFHPTWIGRTEDGDTACFVTDFLLFPGA
ncbi:hypothetical protein GCM10010420_11420 [Streptomyces glaucosporus]|uniref:Uncharacterized protein n=1 Tax=Streptomyces glaucosporus TaxID=284044 RepID=A0ABN3HXM0_9ACTN